MIENKDLYYKAQKAGSRKRSSLLVQILFPELSDPTILFFELFYVPFFL